MNSEFGKGFSYCIGLFLMHTERLNKSFNNDYSLWFNGAADHLFELEIPEKFSDKEKVLIEKWQEKCLNFRLKNATEKDYKEAIECAKNILMLYDKLNNVKTIKGVWE